MSETAAFATGQAPVAGADELDRQLSRDVAAAQQRMARAILVGKLQNDPLADLAEAMAHALGVQHQIHCAAVRLQREASADFGPQLRAAIEVARQPIDPAALIRLEEAAATGADRQAAKLARSHGWRTVLIAAAVLAASIATGVAGGALVERQSQFATEAGITAEAFRAGPAAAAAWLNLMRSNDVVETLAACTGKAVVISDGRHACGIAVWLDGPTSSPPRTGVLTR